MNEDFKVILGLFATAFLAVTAFVSTILIMTLISMIYGAWGLLGVFLFPFWIAGIAAFAFRWFE